jgi:hypothetical protein
MDYHQTAMGLPPVTSIVFEIMSEMSLLPFREKSVSGMYICMIVFDFNNFGVVFLIPCGVRDKIKE